MSVEDRATPEHALPDRVLQWIVDAVDPQMRGGQSIHPLHGGISSRIYRISLLGKQGITEVVFRQFDNEAWLREEPDLARHEAESLRFAMQTGVNTPQLIAFDETGSACGMPSVLMTKLAGAVLLQPPQMRRWLNGLAETLVQIHAVDAVEYPWEYFTYMNMSLFDTPSWSRVPELWQRAIDYVKGPRPCCTPCFIHRDYHPANVLWDQGRVSGVVDWVNACRGPAGVDVGHCRVNLAMLFGVQTADAFLTAYQQQAGLLFEYTPYWDLVALIDILFEPPSVYPGWTALGVTGLTDRLMVERIDDYMISLLTRCHEL